jgi:hypothetical protein
VNVDISPGRGKFIAERLNELARTGAVPGSRIEGTEPGTAIVPGSGNRSGTDEDLCVPAVPGSQPLLREPGTDAENPL